MNRDLVIGIIVAILLHAGLALGGDFFKPSPPPSPPKENIPVIELAPLPPDEPETVEHTDPASDSGGDLADIVPPLQADTPAPTASTFVQQFQPPPPPGIVRPTGTISIPTRVGAGTGGGNGSGFKNLFDLANLDEPPVVRVSVRPNYPLEMSRAGINGQVLISLIIDDKGEVQNPCVVSSTHREFEAEALRAVARWKFKPGRKNGVNVNTRRTLPFVFTISEN